MAQLSLESITFNGEQTTLAETPPAPVTTAPVTATVTTAAQEVKVKTETILDIAQTHPDIEVRSGKLPSGYIISYHLKGGSILTKHVAENEFIESIKRAIPKELREKHEYFRGTVSRELDELTVWIGTNFRFCHSPECPAGCCAL